MIKIFSSIKLVYLYVLYFFVGLDEDYFYNEKGNRLAEIGANRAAIKALERANKDLQYPKIFGAIGWSYLQLEQYENALENYRKAYENDESLEILCGVAVAEMKAGSQDESKRIYEILKFHRNRPGLEIVISNLEKGYEDPNYSGI